MSIRSYIRKLFNSLLYFLLFTYNYFLFSELFYTEKTHVKNLKILEMLFYKPMINDNVNENLTKALFPNIEDILKLHSKFE